MALNKTHILLVLPTLRAVTCCDIFINTHHAQYPKSVLKAMEL